jgi:hypothetical protein
MLHAYVLLTTVSFNLLSASPVSASEAGNAAHHFHSNDIGVFVGGTTPVDEKSGGETAPTLGIDYERRITAAIGVVFMAEIVGDEHKREDLFAVEFAYRVSDLRLGIGPGFELVEEDKPSGGTKRSAYLVVVTRANYEFHVGKINLAPTVGVDFVGETKTNFVYGITVGYGF